MNGLGSHIECLRELERDARPRPPPRPFGLFVAASVFVGLALAGTWWLESLVTDRLLGR